jgi:hypothetical protein
VRTGALKQVGNQLSKIDHQASEHYHHPPQQKSGTPSRGMALLRAVVRAVINDPFSSGVSIATNSCARAAAVSFVSQNDSLEWLPWQPYTDVPPKPRKGGASQPTAFFSRRSPWRKRWKMQWGIGAVL